MSKTKLVVLGVFCVFMSVLFISCGKSSHTVKSTGVKDNSPVLARVGDQTITELDLQAKQDLMHFGEKEREKVLEDMIRSKLIFLAAVEEKVDQTPEVQSRIQDQTEKLVGQVYLNNKITSLNFSDEELKKYYESHKQDFTVPRKAMISHILVSDREMADTVKSEIEAGTLSFDQGVAKYSQDKTTVRNQGKLGTIMEGNFIPSLGPYPEISEQIFQAKPGDFLGPFETSKGFHLIRVDTLIPETFEEFEHSKRRIIDLMAVSESEIEEYYNKVKDERFKKKAFVKIKHILTSTQQEAEQVLTRLKKGEKFEDLVRAVSLDKESVSSGGDLGMIYQDGYVPRIGKDTNFINAVFQLEKGNLSPVIKSAKGYHVVLAYDKEPDSFHALDDVRSSIVNILAGQKRVDLRTKLMADLEQKYTVERLYKTAKK
ncbi:peptidyl-prolyl cis-trans isomerase [bacterium]|nr:peptidyl-prolyl cis-trans isomerase [bacterium]